MNNDKLFSASRMATLIKYYYPTIRTQLIAFPTIALVLGVCMNLLYRHEVGFLFVSMLSTLSALMIYFGPMVFLTKSTRSLAVTLPATWVEKSCFIVVYSLVVINLLVNVPLMLSDFVLNNIFGEPEFMKALNNEITKYMDPSDGMIVRVLQCVMPASVCMYFVMSATRTRAKVIIGTLASLFILVVTGIVWGLTMALNMPMDQGVTSDEIQSYMLPRIIELTSGLMFICLAVILLFIALTVRRIKNIQI